LLAENELRHPTAGHDSVAGRVLTEDFGPGSIAMAVFDLAVETDVAGTGGSFAQTANIRTEFIKEGFGRCNQSRMRSLG